LIGFKLTLASATSYQKTPPESIVLSAGAVLGPPNLGREGGQEERSEAGSQRKCRCFRDDLTSGLIFEYKAKNISKKACAINILMRDNSPDTVEVIGLNPSVPTIIK
jgi:hypothetical protein